MVFLLLGGMMPRTSSMSLRADEIAFFDYLFALGDTAKCGEVSPRVAYQLLTLSDLPHPLLAAVRLYYVILCLRNRCRL